VKYDEALVADAAVERFENQGVELRLGPVRDDKEGTRKKILILELERNSRMQEVHHKFHVKICLQQPLF